MFFKLGTIGSLALLLSFCFSTVLAQESSEAEAHFKRGEASLQAKQYNEAISEFKQAIRIKPDWAEAHFKLGLAYAAIPITDVSFQESYNAALKAFQVAAKLKPDWAEAHNEVGRRTQGDKAIRSLKEAIRLKPELAEAHQNLGIAYLYSSHFKEAIDCLLEAIRLEPDRPLPHKLLGLAYLVVDDREKALQQHQVLTSLDREMADYLNTAIQSPTKPTFGVANGKLLSVPKPEYPAAAKRARITGSVTVQVTIDEKGAVTEARALNGPTELRSAAEGAALKARFQPTKLSGKPVSVKGVITFNFAP
jgi:TonB family protein